ncbi:MAG TPA: 23S rRNA (guanosine(2251)-2'-O)-methyltransferase RlmB [Mycobacteriales bacterium]|nr:23S rRNA (guanosine(2251)-2'-O)-methyltransferase RlmB [Mycobacteriales bacterium]
MAPGKRVGGGKAVAKGGQGGRAGKAGSHRKGAPVGSGGHGKDKLKGKGPTPPAEERKGHPAARRAAAAAKRDGRPAEKPRGERGQVDAPGPWPSRRPATRRTPVGIAVPRGDAPARRQSPTKRAPAPRRGLLADVDEVVAGRNPVVEALRAGVPARTLVVAHGLDHDDRVTEALKTAAAQHVPVREAGKPELDRLTEGAVHQGLALVVAPYDYAHPDDLLRRAFEHPEPPLLVALDGVTDPRNLGAVVRSAAAFGAHGVVVPERRAAGLTAAAWKASAGTAARVPVARATNLTRTLRSFADAGVSVVGLAADGELSLDDLELATEPLCVVVGSEGRGLGRLVGETCDVLVRIPMVAETESLNASVAAAVTLAEVARRRRTGP